LLKKLKTCPAGLMVVLEDEKQRQRADFGKPDAEDQGLKNFSPSKQSGAVSL